jgi:hypothetical protein
MSEAPLFEVVAGQPSAKELAALTAVLAGVRAARAQAAAAAAPRNGTSHWADRAALVRMPVVPGPGAWRRSSRPR